MSDRLLSTLSLPPATLSALVAAGYETVSELSNTTPEQLSNGLCLHLRQTKVLLASRLRSRKLTDLALQT